MTGANSALCYGSLTALGGGSYRCNDTSPNRQCIRSTTIKFTPLSAGALRRDEVYFTSSGRRETISGTVYRR